MNAKKKQKESFLRGLKLGFASSECKILLNK